MSRRRDVEFLSDHLTLRGWLQTPDGKGPHPLVILAHGLGGLKEWTIPEVADVLVGQGIAAMTFDYRNFGDSEGVPREEVDHCGQIEDWKNAITFASTLPEIDPKRIGLWGTSLGGRNVLAVAGLDRRIACVVAQGPLIAGSPAMAAYMCSGGDIDRFYCDLAEDRRNRALGGEPGYVTFETGLETEHGEYWATFGEAEKRNWTPRVTFRSFEPSLASDIRHIIPQIAPTPLMMIIADRDIVCPTADQRAAFESAGEPKSLVELNGHHYSCYTTQKAKAIGAARDWFVKYLKQ